MSDSQHVTTAMCVWEWIVENRGTDLRIKDWLDRAGGTAQLRSDVADLADQLDTYATELSVDTGWNSPFDWEVVPKIMDLFLSFPDVYDDDDESAALMAAVRQVYEDDTRVTAKDRLFHVDWSKTYISSGTETIVARDQLHAESLIQERLGDLEGSMEYDPDYDSVTATEVEQL